MGKAGAMEPRGRFGRGAGKIRRGEHARFARRLCLLGLLDVGGFRDEGFGAVAGRERSAPARIHEIEAGKIDRKVF